MRGSLSRQRRLSQARGCCCTSVRIGVPIASLSPHSWQSFMSKQIQTRTLEVIYVSSDEDAAACEKYMKEKHGDWLRIPYKSPLREEIKKKYGCFASKEAGNFPGVERRNGIPSLVAVEANGNEADFAAHDKVEKCKNEDAVAGIVAAWP